MEMSATMVMSETKVCPILLVAATKIVVVVDR
jgi:hypothetical protein